MRQENKTIREIAYAAHLSFTNIKKISRRIDGNVGNTDLSNRSKETQALWLFEHKKCPIDVAIQLNIPYSRVEELQQEYWALKELYDLAFVYMEIKNYLTPFLQLVNLLKKNKMLSEKYISQLLRYACHDLPTLENRIRQLRSDVIELDFRKKDSKDTIKLQSAQLFDLVKRLRSFRVLSIVSNNN